MEQNIYLQAADAAKELIETAKLADGEILVVGCSSSEIVGENIGHGSSIESAEAVYKDVPKDELARVKAGKIEKNMHTASVLVVLGPPALSRTSKLTNQSWLYWQNRDVVFRLIFRKNKIRQIGSLDKLDI